MTTTPTRESPDTNEELVQSSAETFVDELTELAGSRGILTRTKKQKALSGESSVEINAAHHDQLELMREDEEVEQQRKDQLLKRWQDSPERTRRLRRKMATTDMAAAAIDQGDFGDMWVQCELPDCLKWRRLSQTASESLDENAPWYCHMNTNHAYQACATAQEDFKLVERMANRLGIKYITSCLAEGTVVWCKTAGYCRWPALITTDYCYGSHVAQNSNEDPVSYHVEYLGEVHTHNWLSAYQIAAYGSVDEEKQLMAATAPTFSAKKRKMKGRQRVTQKKGSEKGARIFRKDGVKCTIVYSIEEAEDLLKLALPDRLEKVVFGAGSFMSFSEASSTDSFSTTDAEYVPATPRSKSRSKVCKKKPASRRRQSRSSKQLARRRAPAGARGSDTSREVAPPSPQPSLTGVEAIKRQLHKQKAMVECKNKEEKFSIDVQMYQKNEKAFEHDVRRFMIRHERPITLIPRWNGIPVNLFQLFLAVYDRGGYHQVIKNRKFQQVYREVAGLVAVNTGGTKVKRYYERNLLPYELYVNNKDYAHCFEETKPTTSKLPRHSKLQQGPKTKAGTQPKQAKPKSNLSEHAKVNIQVEKAKVADPYPDTSQEVPAASFGRSGGEAESFSGMTESELRELDYMLTQLDSFSGFYRKGVQSTSTGDKLGDQSLLEGDTASLEGFGSAALPLEEAQIVPELLEGSEEYEYVEL